MVGISQGTIVLCKFLQVAALIEWRSKCESGYKLYINSKETKGMVNQNGQKGEKSSTCDISFDLVQRLYIVKVLGKYY